MDHTHFNADTQEAASVLDLLLYSVRGLAALEDRLKAASGSRDEEAVSLIREGLFLTDDFMCYDAAPAADLLRKVQAAKRRLYGLLPEASRSMLPEASLWDGGEETWLSKAASPEVRILSDMEDIASLMEMIIRGVQGANTLYARAEGFGKSDPAAGDFFVQALAATADGTRTMSEYLNLLMETGRCASKIMDMLDEAQIEVWKNPEITRIDTGVRKNPGILVAGSDLRVLESVLHQTEGTGIDVYTFDDLSSAKTYPFFKSFKHFAGNYGGAWHEQQKAFESFGGPIIHAGPWLLPPLDSYRNRMWTCGGAHFPGVPHIEGGFLGALDFRDVIRAARDLPAPAEYEASPDSYIVGGFSHKQMSGLSGMIYDHIRSGSIRRLAVICGSDSDRANASYYTDFASSMPAGTIILTAGSVKFRFNKLGLGDILGIPKVLDAGRGCDIASLLKIAITFRELFNLSEISDLPFAWMVSMRTSADVAGLLALLAAGVRNIKIGPSLPGFISVNIASILENTWGVTVSGEAAKDAAALSSRGGTEDKPFTGKVRITEDMLVGDIVQMYPEVVPLLLSCGLHCIGCGASTFETLTEACAVHGIPVDEVLELIDHELGLVTE